MILYYLSTEHKFCVALRGQTTAETFTCSEIVVLRTTAEMVEGLRYKLRVLGVPTDGPCDVFCDNAWVVPSTSRPEDPSLRNKHCSYRLTHSKRLNCCWY